MEKPGPEFRIVGGAPEEQKEQERKELEKAFEDHFEQLPPKAQELLRATEYPKSEKELALIAFANAETNRLMQKASVAPFDVPSANYHIVPEETYKEIRGPKGEEGGWLAHASYRKQGMFFNAKRSRTNPLLFCADALHETLHLKGHTSYEVELEEETGKTKKGFFRTGIGVKSSVNLPARGDHEHFAGLHEAIVSAQEKRSFSKILDLPELAEEKKWLESEEAKERTKKLIEERGIPEDEIYWIGKEEGDRETFSYPSPRLTLDYVLTEIQKAFPARYSSQDEVFDEFLKAHFSGHLLSVARLVERTFGEGSFRRLGDMSTDRESAVLTLEALRKARAGQARVR